MKKIGIIGVGHVGSTTAYTLIQQQVADELVLFDKNKKLVEAEVNDLIQGQIGQQSTIRIKGNDLKELKTCDLLIFSAGDISILQEDTDRFRELNYTKQVVEEWAPIIKRSGFSGIILSITNPCDVITRYLQELTGFPRNKVFGTGTALDTTRMQQAVSTMMNVHPNSIQGYVLGEHGETQFIAWSTVLIANEPLLNQLSKDELITLNDQARAAGWRIIHGKAYTCYGIANQAAILAKAILTDAHLVKPVSVYSESEHIYIGQPALIGKDGVIKIYPLELNKEEQSKWKNSVARIKEMYAAI